jgi:phosphoglycerol transferase MdoB-like AlkP superfamily enzyme
MVKGTIGDYINDDKFLVYYTTISGHANYDLTNNKIVKKNYDKVKDLSYSEIVKYYIATEIELDKALEYLINSLEEAGKLEDTVILLSGDHPPYTLSLDELNEASNIERDNTILKYKSNLIIYNSEVKTTKVEKVCSTLDVLPTMLNLFGIDYDARLLMGRDIFSNSTGLVIFSNRSFIYGDSIYNSITESLESGSLTSEEVTNIQNIVYSKFKYSRLILENNYYKYINTKED